jgi:hypothetical protein
VTRKIFYSWQSTLDSKRHRYFIREALVKAVDRLGDDPEIEDRPELDSDTSGVAGFPNIVSAIFEKIDSADVFVPDLTIVHRCEGAAFPNPNVLLETGYAIKSLGYARIVGVMNAAEGRPEDLPFDLRAHRPTMYKLPPDGERRVVLGQLSSTLEEALRLILKQPSGGRSADPFVALPDSDAFAAARQASGGRVVRYQVVAARSEPATELSIGTLHEALRLAAGGKLAPHSANDLDAMMAGQVEQLLRASTAPRGDAPRPYQISPATAGPNGLVLWRHFYNAEAMSAAGEECFFIDPSGRIGYQRATCGDELDLYSLLRDAAVLLRLAGHTFVNAMVGRTEPGQTGRHGAPLALTLGIDVGKDTQELTARVIDSRGLVRVVPPSARWWSTSTAEAAGLFAERERLARAVHDLARGAVNPLVVAAGSRSVGKPFLDIELADVLARVEKSTAAGAS